MAEERRGDLEMTIRFTPAGGGEAVECTSTPSMWALADEWVDELAARSLAAGRAHTRTWLNGKMVACIQLMAGQAEGILPDGKPSLDAIALMLNAWDVDIVGEGEPDGEGEPGPTGAPAAA